MASDCRKSAKYIPALRFHWLTPFFDRLMCWTMRDATFKYYLVEQAQLQPGWRVLDLGCGSGTLALEAKTSCPVVTVVVL